MPRKMKKTQNMWCIITCMLMFWKGDYVYVRAGVGFLEVGVCFFEHYIVWFRNYQSRFNSIWFIQKKLCSILWYELFG